MENRDFIKDQIEQAGKVLGKIITNFLKLNSSGDITNQIKVTNQQLQSELNIDLGKLILFNKKELRDFIEKRNFTTEHLEQLSEYLIKVGAFKIKNNQEGGKACLETALELLEVTDDISQTLSLDRVQRKNDIESLLNKNL